MMDWSVIKAEDLFNAELAQAESSLSINAQADCFYQAEEDFGASDYVVVQSADLIAATAEKREQNPSAAFAYAENLVKTSGLWAEGCEESTESWNAKSGLPGRQTIQETQALWQNLINAGSDSLDVFCTDDAELMFPEQEKVKVDWPFSVVQGQKKLVFEASIPNKLWQQLNSEQEITLRNVVGLRNINLDSFKINYHDGHLKLEIADTYRKAH